MKRSLRLPAWLALFAAVHMVVLGCGKESNWKATGPSDTAPPEFTYGQNAINADTNASGRLRVHSGSILQGQQVTYDLTVKDASGKAVRGLQVSYDEVNGKSLLYIYDASGRYVPAVIFGTPQEIAARFGAPLQSVTTESGKQIFFIPLLIVIALITVAEVSFIIKAYRISNFYLTDAVEQGEDYIMYCKTWDEIAQLIKDRIGAVLNLTSIVTAYATFGIPSMNMTAWGQTTEKLATASVNQLRDHLLQQAVTAWGVSEEQIRDRRVAVKVYPFDQGQFASRFRNIWATFVIERDNPICDESGGTLSGRITSATTGSAISGVAIGLSGPAQRSTTSNASGEYRFQDLPNGAYTVTATKSGFVAESREASLSGTPVVLNIVMSPVISSSEYRAVLTWGVSPSDLDSHLWIGSQYHVYYFIKGSATSPPYAELDIDDISGEGPETITIHRLTDPCKYAVHNYSGMPAITTSQAVVRLYRGSQLIRTYDVPTSGSGAWWYVFDLSSGGQVTDRDFLTESPPAATEMSVAKDGGSLVGK